MGKGASTRGARREATANVLGAASAQPNIKMLPQHPVVVLDSGRPVAEHSIPLLLQRLDDLTQRRIELEQAALELIEGWRSAFARGSLPFYLTQLSGESLTLLRWRRAATTPGAGGRRFELMDTAETSLRAQAVAVRRLIFDFERRRVAINYEYALTAYEQHRLTDLLRQRRRLAQARKLLGG